MCSKYVVLYIYSYRTVVRLYTHTLHTYYTLTASLYVHGLISLSYSDSLFTMDAPPDPRSQIPHTTNSTASPYVHGLNSFSYSDSLFTMDAPPDPRSQIPHTTNSTASPYVHGLISFSYSDSLFTMDAPFTPHPVHTRSQIPDPTHHKFHSLSLRPRSHLILL